MTFLKNNSLNISFFLTSFALLLSIHLIKSLFSISTLYYIELIFSSIVLGSFVLLIRKKIIINITPKTIRKILIFAVLLYIALFSLLAILRYLSYTSNVLDLGTFLQPLSNTIRGRFMEYTSMDFPFNEKCRFGNHFELIYLPLSLFSNIFPGPYFYLILQTIVLAASAFPLYRLSGRITNRTSVALGISLSYLCYTGLHFLNLFDIHGDAFAVLFIFLAYDALLRERKKFWVYLIMSFLCKEYVALSGIGFGLTILFTHKKKTIGLITVTLSIFYFLSVHYWIMPLFNRGDLPLFEISRHYRHVGGEKGIFGILTYIFSHPEKSFQLFVMKENMESIFYVFFPVAFLSLFSPLYLIGAFPIIFKDMLFGMNIGNHRLGVVIPYVFISLVYTIKKIYLFQEQKKWLLLKSNAVMIYLFSFSLIAMFFYGPTPLGHRFWREKKKYIIDEKDRARNQIIKNIPDNVVISVSSHMFPHVAKRQVCYIYPRPWSNEIKDFGNVEYICVDTMDTKLVIPEMKKFNKDALKVITDQGYKKIKAEKGIFLFKKVE